MKKKITAFLLSLSIACSLSVPAFAQGAMESITTLYQKAYSGEPIDINIMYNGKLLTYSDVAPQNINDRVMIPFRTVLESMGATVAYDEATKTVTASRDDTTITFTLGNDTIYINKSGVKSEIKMDVPMVNVNDRTLVPVRFMTQALGMQVGWDSQTKAVVLVDMENYIKDLQKDAPNLFALLSKPSQTPSLSASDLKISFNMENPQMKPTTLNLGLDSKTNSTFKNGVFASDSTVSINWKELSDIIPFLQESNVSLANIDNVTINEVVDKSVVYLKTDLFEKIAAQTPNDIRIKQIATFIDKDTWIKIDIQKLIQDMVGANSEFAVLGNLSKALSNGLFASSGKNGIEMIKEIYTSQSDMNLMTASSLDSAFSTYAMIDKYINLVDKGDGAYDVSININNDMYKDIILSQAKQMGASEAEVAATINEISKMLNIEMVAKTSVTSNDMIGNFSFNFGVDTTSLYNNNNGVKIKFSMTGSQKDTIKSEVSDIKVPGAAIDFENTLKALN